MIKVAAISLVSFALLGAALEKKPPAATCEYANTVELLANARLSQLDKIFDSTEPYSPLREVVGAEIIGILDLLNDVENFKKKNCKES